MATALVSQLSPNPVIPTTPPAPITVHAPPSSKNPNPSSDPPLSSAQITNPTSSTALISVPLIPPCPLPISGSDPPPMIPSHHISPLSSAPSSNLVSPATAASTVLPCPNSSTAGHPSFSGGPAPASHDPILGPSAHRVPSSSYILSDPLPSVSSPSPIIPVQGLSPPPPIIPSMPRPPFSGRSLGAAPPLSYAQAARGPRGPGFVRSHAADVESFARLPRTGANIICGSREGAPSFSFVSSDLPKVEEIYSNALIMKFLGGRPSLEASHKEILNWGIEKPFSIGPMSSRAYLLRFQDSKDLVRVLSRPSSILITFPYRVFRWHNQYHIKEDSCFAPVWISLPKLPLLCFIPEFLEAVANKIGRFLCFDKATATLARPSVARMCVELDLRKNPPPFIWVGLFEGLKQPVIYERMPKFCSQCLSQGHVALACPWGQRETLPIQSDHRPDPGPDRPPYVRRNAPKRSSSKSHINSSSGSFVSSSTPHPHTSTATTTHSIPPISTVSTQPVVELRPLDSSQLTPSVCRHAPSHLSAYSSGGNASKMSSNPNEGLGNQQQPHPQIDRQSDTGPNPAATISPQPSTNGCMNRSVSADTQQGQHPGLSSLSSTSPISSLPQSSHGSQLPNDTPILPLPTDPTLVQPPALAETHLSPPTKSKSKTRIIRPKKKSVSFKLPGQSNLSANVGFWSAVNNHISNTTSVPSSTGPSDNQTRNIATFDTSKIHPALWEAVNRQASILDQARLTGSQVGQSHHSSSRATAPNPPVSSPFSPNTNLSTMSPSTSDSESSIAADSPPYSPKHISHGAQYDAFSLKPSFYKSEGEDSGTEEARFQGHFSDDMSCAKPKSSRKNKRHPDQPLNVQLRARKGGGY